MESVWDHSVYKKPNLRNHDHDISAREAAYFIDDMVHQLDEIEAEPNTRQAQLSTRGGVERDLYDDRFPKAPESDKGLNLTQKKLTDADLTALARHLKAGHRYNALFLGGNQFSHLGLVTLLEVLKTDQLVRHLILPNNHLNQFAMAGLADLFKVNHFIGWLVLNKNAVGTFGVKIFSDCLPRNKGLKHLILSDNEIEDMTALVENLMDHPRIESLFLQRNPILKKGYKALAALIAQSKTLKRVDLRRTGHGDCLEALDLKALGRRQGVEVRL